MNSRYNKYDYSIIPGDQVPLIKIMNAADSRELRGRATTFLNNRVFIEKENDIPVGSLVEFKLVSPDSDMYLARGYTEWSNDGSINGEATGIGIKLIEMYRLGNHPQEEEPEKVDPAGNGQPQEESSSQEPESEQIEEADEENDYEEALNSGMSFIPEPSSVSELLESLIGSKPSFEEDEEIDIGRENLSALASFALDDGTLKILWVFDYRAVIYIGSVLAEVPTEETKEYIESKEIPEDLMENFKEVINIGASLFNKPELPHISLEGVILSNEEIPEALSVLVSNPANRVDYTVEFPDYGESSMAILEK